jgi:hypothetical protein
VPSAPTARRGAGTSRRPRASRGTPCPSTGSSSCRPARTAGSR